MPQVSVENLVKTFTIAERQRGTQGALRGLVQRRYRTIPALNGISFTLEPGEEEIIARLYGDHPA
jgi:ABC-2 type transport system ATP-binding protein